MADPAESNVFPAAVEGLEDAGGPMMGGGFGAKPAAPGVGLDWVGDEGERASRSMPGYLCTALL